MKAEEFSERTVEVGRWQVRLTSYRIDGRFYTHADNVSPGATLARTQGATREEAESEALSRAERRLDSAIVR